MNRIAARLGFFLFANLLSAAAAFSGDWAAWRGPYQNGVSMETGLPNSTKDILWRIPLGGHSTPVIVDGRIYAIHLTGKGVDEQEQMILPRCRGRARNLALQFQLLSHRRAGFPHRLGQRRGRSRDGQRLRQRRARDDRLPQSRRQIAVVEVVGANFTAASPATGDAPIRRSSTKTASSWLSTTQVSARSRRSAPLSGPGQEERRYSLVEHARRTPGRPHLLQSGRSGDQRPAAGDRRQCRWLRLRDQSPHGRKGLGIPRQSAGP